MDSIAYDGFERFVDYVIDDALGLLSNQLQREIIIWKFGLRDGIYWSDREIGDALGMTAREVNALGREALQLLLEARRDGRIKIGAYG